MNKVILIGRLCADPEVRQSEVDMAIAKYRLAVDRRYKRDEEQNVDYIRCVAFGKNAEFAEKYLHRGIKIAISGRIQTGSYTNKDGQKIYTTDIIVEEHYFCERKETVANTSGEAASPYGPADENGFMNVPDGIDEELPFN